jgi:hypothetical protein
MVEESLRLWYASLMLVSQLKGSGSESTNWNPSAYIHVWEGRRGTCSALSSPASGILQIFHRMTAKASTVLASEDFVILATVLGW